MKAFLVAFATLGAAQNTAVMLDGALEVRTVSPWPEHLAKGYLPVHVELRSSGARELDVSLVLFASSRNRHTVERTVRLAPGERRRVELLAPVFVSEWGRYKLTVRCRGQREELHGLAALQPIGGDPRPGVHLSPDERSQAEMTALAESLSQSELILSGQPRQDNVSLRSVPFADMPERYAAYSSLAFVLLDLTRAAPEAAQREALLTWGRLGGTIVLVGVAPGDVAARLGGDVVREWAEERMWLPWPDGEDGLSLEAFAFGLGRIVFAPGGIPERSSGIDALAELLHRGEGTLPRSEVTPPSIPGLGDLPLRAFLVLLVSFAVLIGPVNFILVKKSGRPILLLLTIPGVALLASVAILLYGVFAQGIGVQSAASSLTVLDQRRHVADTVRLETLFCGLPPGPGLAPAAGTSVYPALTAGALRDGDGEDRVFRIDEDRGLLAGDFLPVRKPFLQRVLQHASARGRVTFRWTPEGLVAENGLAQPIRRLTVPHVQGNGEAAWYAGVEIPSGGSLVLEQTASPMRHLFGLPDELVDVPLLVRWFGGGVTDAYLALVDANPFVDDCGIASEEKSGAHFVLGVLAVGSLRADAGEGGR